MPKNKCGVVIPKLYSHNLDMNTDGFLDMSIRVIKDHNGDFTVVGSFDRIQSLVDDICIGDSAAIEEIMETCFVV